MNLTYSLKVSAYLLHNEELHNVHSSPNKIIMIKSRMMRWTGHEARMGSKRNAYRILVAKPERKGPRCRWADNNKINLRVIGWCGMG
jgi:hypothetical protein